MVNLEVHEHGVEVKFMGQFKVSKYFLFKLDPEATVSEFSLFSFLFWIVFH
jgi:hypothetical protein